MDNGCANIVNLQNSRPARFFSQLTSAETRAYLKNIESTLKDHQSANAEITDLYRYLLRSENPVSWNDVLIKDLPSQYSKWQYALRIYLLRSLTYDKTVFVMPEHLNKASGNTRVGIMAALDFMLTRKPQRAEYLPHIDTLMVKFRTLDDPTSEKKYQQAVDTYKKIICRSVESGLDLTAIKTFKSLQERFKEVIEASPDKIYSWLQYLKTEFQRSKLTSKEKERFSRALFNVGLHYTEHKIIVAIWSFSIWLDDPTTSSISVLSDKVSRLIMTTRSFPDEDFRAIILGIRTGLDLLSVGPMVELVESSVLTHFGKISGSLLSNVESLPVITRLLLSSANDEYTPLISRLIIQMILYSGKLARRIDVNTARPHFRDLMKMANLAELSLETVVELEWCYCSLFQETYDYERLLTFLEKPNEESKVTVLIMLARHDRMDPAKSYNWCEKLVRLTQGSAPQVSPILEELGFFDLNPEILSKSKSCMYPPLHKERQQIHEIKSNLAQLLHDMADVVALIDFNVKSWQALRFEGCYCDALEHLLAAWNLSNKAYGVSSVRASTYQELFLSYMKRFNMDEKTLGSREWLIAAVSNRQDAPQSLESCKDLYMEHLRPSTPKFIAYDLFVKEFIRFQTLVHNFHPAPVLSEPVLFRSHKMERKNNRVSLKRSFAAATSASEQVDINEIPWKLRTTFVRKLRWLRLAAAHYDLHWETRNSSLYRKVFANQMHMSRSYHVQKSVIPVSGVLALPSDTVCICLDTEDDDNTFTITRFEPGCVEPITIQLPLHESSIEGVTEGGSNGNLVADTLKFIKDGLMTIEIPDKSDRRKISQYKENLKRINGEFDSLTHRIQKSFLGGLAGFLTARNLSENVPVLVQQLNNHFSKVGISIDSVMANLMRESVSHIEGVPSLEDVVRSIWPSASNEFCRELRTIISNCGREVGSGSCRNRAVLIVDERLSQIPWELLPVLRSVSVTRALSLLHLQELIQLSKMERSEIQPSETQHSSASVQNASFLLDPQRDVPGSGELHESFKQRGWRGFYRMRPTSTELSQLLETPFIYVGHGSASKFLHKDMVRKKYPSTAPIYLLGCRSVALNWPSLDSGALIDHAIRGSSMIMGSIWVIRNTDFNRFTTEFFARVFDHHQRPSDALRDSREVCDTPFLTGAAAVIYGLP